MARIRSAEPAKKALSSCAPEHEFCVNDGRRLKSLQELADALNTMDDSVFMGHADRGDFSNWIRDIFSDGKLADDLKGLKNKKVAASRVLARLDFLKKLS